MKLDRRMRLAMAVWCGIAAGTACNRDAGEREGTGDSPAKGSASATASTRRTGLDRNACNLLTIDEVSAAVGVPVKAQEMSNASGSLEVATDANRERGRSDCWWNGPDGQARLGLTAYWIGGRQGWEINGASRSMAKGMIAKQEGVAFDSVVKNGLVPGLGDKAFFSPILQSLVLKDDVLLEITTSLLPEPEAQFRPLVTKMLSRL